MDINAILPLLANMCIYYYITYHEKILHEQINIPDVVHVELMKRIYNQYMSMLPVACQDGYVHDIMIMDGFYSQQYELNKQLDAVEIMHVIDEYIEFHAYYYNTSIPINVISLSPHPIENYICFNHSWIKWIIDLYRY